MKHFWLCTMMLFGCAAFAGSLPALNAADGTVFPAEHARELLGQCSRAVPQNVDGTWVPVAAQIRELEARLPQALADAFARKGTSEYQGGRNVVRQRYGRQYGGLVVHGRRIIYVNAFYYSFIDAYHESPSDLGAFKRGLDWHRTTVGVCDGGENFWGVEYDPATGIFSHFAFNGRV